MNSILLCFISTILCYCKFMKNETREYALQMLIRMTEEKRIPCHKTRLPFRYLSDVPDNGLRVLLYGAETVPEENFPIRFYQEHRWNCYILTDVFQYHYFFLPLPSQDEVRVFGPYILGTHSSAVIREVRRLNRLSAREAEIYRQFSAALPHVYDAELLEGIFRSFCSFWFQEENYQISSWETSLIRPAKTRGNIEKPAFQELEKRYAAERLFMKSISEGDILKAQALLSSLSSRGMESRSGSLLRDAKNYMIVFNTLCRLSAYQGGAHPQEVDSLSHEYSLRIENAADFSELRPVREDIVRSYCAAVSADHSGIDSLQIKRAAAYIASNFSEPATLAETADHLGITKTYLSALFRKETGMTFSEYVRKHRLSTAAELLAATQMSIDEIAAYCGIPDSNYFSRMFRKEYGMSATQYRMSERKKQH